MTCPRCEHKDATEVATNQDTHCGTKSGDEPNTVMMCNNCGYLWVAGCEGGETHTIQRGPGKQQVESPDWRHKAPDDRRREQLGNQTKNGARKRQLKRKRRAMQKASRKRNRRE